MKFSSFLFCFIFAAVVALTAMEQRYVEGQILRGSHALAQVKVVPKPNPLGAASKEMPEDLGTTTGAIAVPVPSEHRPEKNKAAQQASNEVVEDKRIYQAACPAMLSNRVTAKMLVPISDRQCGQQSPLEVTAVGKIKFSGKAVMNCTMATSTADWTEVANKLANTMIGSEVTELVTSTSYQCRCRNNLPTGKISEHGFANALDIIGFRLNDGQSISLINDWNDGADGADAPQSAKNEGTGVNSGSRNNAAFLRQVRDEACKHFSHVLGPDSNALHADHFHFDLGCHGKRCRSKICE